MGMFDDPKPFSDTFQEGQVFLLEAAKIGNPISTDYGVSSPVLLKIGNQWYSVFGQGLKNQVERMDNGDLPARVRIERVPTRSGQQVKLLVPEGKDATPADENAPF